MASTQHYTCSRCDCEWSRPTVRGRVPKFCPSCRVALRVAKRDESRECAGCGKIGLRYDATYCSRACSTFWLSGKRVSLVEYRDCPHCGELFTVHPKQRRHCSAPPPPRVIPITRQCRQCDSVFSSPQHSKIVCSKRCQRKRHKQLRRARERGAFGEFTWAGFMRIARKFDYCCAYCGVKPPDGLDPEHVVPLSLGGPNTVANLLPSCRSCNSDKRDLPLEMWANDRQRRGLSPVRTTWDHDDIRFNHLTSLPARADLATA